MPSSRTPQASARCSRRCDAFALSRFRYLHLSDSRIGFDIGAARTEVNAPNSYLDIRGLLQFEWVIFGEFRSLGACKHRCVRGEACGRRCRAPTCRRPRSGLFLPVAPSERHEPSGHRTLLAPSHGRKPGDRYKSVSRREVAMRKSCQLFPCSRIPQSLIPYGSQAHRRSTIPT